MDQKTLFHILKQRYPVVLLDKIEQINSESLVALKNVTLHDCALHIAQAENASLPNGVLLDCLIQAATVLYHQFPEMADHEFSLSDIEKFHVQDALYPGDQIRIEMDNKSFKKDRVVAVATVLNNGRIVCEAQLACNVTQSPSRPQIHPTAWVHPTAVLGKDVAIGPYSIVGEHAIIGDRTMIEAHVMIEKWTEIGHDCHIHFGAVIGSAAQDHKYKGEKARVVIGNHNVIREYVTINRATGENNDTRIGDHNMILTSVHIAHNCVLGNHITIVNMATVAGHSVVEDHVVIGGMAGIHQFSRIGRGAMVGALARIPADVLPFMLCEGNPAAIYSLNVVGLKRAGVGMDGLRELKLIFKLLFRSNLNTKQALDEIAKTEFKSEQAHYLIRTLQSDSTRGFIKKSVQNETEGESDNE